MRAVSWWCDLPAGEGRFQVSRRSFDRVLSFRRPSRYIGGMTQAYTPGLKVSRCSLHRCRRVLPVSGQVLVDAGDDVGATTIVAQTELPGLVTPVNVANLLSLATCEVPRALTRRRLGERVGAGELLAESPGIFGFFRKRCTAPVDGVIESVSGVTGQVMLRGAPRFVQLTAYLAGRVVEILPGEGVSIETHATHIQGIFGIGGEAFGAVLPVCSSADQPLSTERLTPECRGKIVIGGSRVTAATLNEARRLGVAAVVTGGIDDQDLRDFLGYDLGVATTGSEQMGLTLIITEGFGEIAMARRTFDLLLSRAGAEGACTGATQIRAGVLRPEIVIPWGTAPRQEPAEAGPVSSLTTGALVRVIRDPYFGTIGAVAHLPPEPVTLESGSRARVLEVKTVTGATLRVPRANVEIIEDES